MKIDHLLEVAEAIRMAESPGGRPMLKAYQDPLGVWTIGHGENLQELEIDEQQAERWLMKSILRAEREAERFPWFAGLSVVRQQAVIEMLYNMGFTRFLTFRKMIAALAEGDFETASAEAFASRWREQVGPTRSGRIMGMIRKG